MRRDGKSVWGSRNGREATGRKAALGRSATTHAEIRPAHGARSARFAAALCFALAMTCAARGQAPSGEAPASPSAAPGASAPEAPAQPGTAASPEQDGFPNAAMPTLTLPDPDAERPGRPARAPAPGDEVVVTMHDGQRLTGKYVSGTAQAVIVKIAGIDLTIQRADLEQIVVQRPVRERYKEIRAMIDEGDVPRLLLLAEWLRDRGLLDEAAAELAHIAKIEPTNVEASRLRILVENQLAMRGAAPAEHESPSPRPGDADRRPTPTPAGRPGEEAEGEERAALTPGFPPLTQEQVNLIKVYEIDLGGSTRMVIERPTIEKLLRDYADSPHIPTTREGRERFFTLAPADILNVMFRVQARELYGEVKVLGNPPAMKLFRDNVNRAWLVNTCASPGCHGFGAGGGEAKSGLVLFNRRTSSEQSFYSNFVILDRYRLADGTALIDYDNPERSPLLQMGLQRAEAARPHPEVPGWAPVFRTMEDRRFRQAVEWIESMYEPRPEYPFEYPPGGQQTGKVYEPVPR